MMRIFFKAIAYLFLLILIAVLLIWIFGSRQKMDPQNGYDQSQFDNIELGQIDAYLTTQESQFDDIKQGQQKQVIWAGAAEQKTDIAIVYIHGFSASLGEIQPVSDNIARELGANIYYTRLAGHGRPGAAMAEVDVNDWLADYDEAMRIGHEIGERVYVIGTSTGGSLVAYALANPFAKPADGAILISPNFAVNNPSAVLASWPGFKWWGPMVAGETRSWEPSTALHDQYWTTSYPTVSVIPMMVLLQKLGKVNQVETPTPVLFYYSPDDIVVDPNATQAMEEVYKAQVHHPELNPEDDPYAHVIAGDALSPSQNAATTEFIRNWISQN